MSTEDTPTPSTSMDDSPVENEVPAVQHQNQNGSTSSSASALRDNIEKKGKNAYYFAHAHKVNGPKWDGKAQPRLLAKHSSVGDIITTTIDDDDNDNNNGGNSSLEFTGDSNQKELCIANATESFKRSLSLKKSMQYSFDYSKSNITKYAFLDEGKKVKIYVEMKGVGESCVNEDDVTLDWDEQAFSLVVKNYTFADTTSSSTDLHCLSFGRLHGLISNASFRKKTDRIIVTLTKKVEEGEEPTPWPTIGCKGAPDHEVV